MPISKKGDAFAIDAGTADAPTLNALNINSVGASRAEGINRCITSGVYGVGRDPELVAVFFSLHSEASCF